MKFTIDRETFLRPLVVSAGVVETKNAQPILNTLLLECTKDQVIITGTDNEMTMVSFAHLVGNDLVDTISGRVAVNAKKLVDIVKSFVPGALIDVFWDSKQRLCLKSGQGRFELAVLPADEFPQLLGQLLDMAYITISTSLLKEKIKLTAFAMAAQDVRSFLKGLFLHASQDGVRFVATDGHRLALSELPFDADQLSKEIIIPRKAVNEISRLLTEAPDTVRIAVGDSHIQIEVASYCFTSKLIEGNYPDYTRVIPKNFRDQVVVDRDELKSSLQRVAILSNDSLRCVRFSFSPGTLRISATNQDAEQAYEELPCDFSGQELSIGLNVNYVLDVLEVIKGPVVHFNIIDAASSIVLRSEDDLSSLFVIMPMRI